MPLQPRIPASAAICAGASDPPLHCRTCAAAGPPADLEIVNARILLASAVLHAGALLGAAVFASGRSAAPRAEPPQLFFVPAPASAPLPDAASEPPRFEVELPEPPAADALPDPTPSPIVAEEPVVVHREPVVVESLFAVPPRAARARLQPEVDEPVAEAEPVTPPRVAAAPPAAASVFVEARAREAENEKPDYPRVAIRRGWTGTVWLRLRIDERGRVQRVDMLDACRHAVLNRSAIAAARAWVFEPARRDGLAVASEKDVPVEFRLVDQ